MIRGRGIPRRGEVRAGLAATAALIALLVTAPGAIAQDQQASLPDIEDEVMCPICGTTLELSESPQAERERELIRDLIDQGRDKEEIKDALVAEYGEDVLASPGDEGFDLSAWLVPALGGLLAIFAVTLTLVRLARRNRAESGGSGEIDPADANRLERDISSYDL